MKQLPQARRDGGADAACADAVVFELLLGQGEEGGEGRIGGREGFGHFDGHS